MVTVGRCSGVVKTGGYKMKEEAEDKITEEMLMDKIESYIKSIKDDPSIPYFILSGSGPGLYYSIGHRTMVCI